MQGKWGAILDQPGRGPPRGARGLCPAGGFEYATVVFHYGRTLALAAKAEGAAAAGDLPSVVEWYAGGAATSLARLRVRPLLLRIRMFRVLKVGGLVNPAPKYPRSPKNPKRGGRRGPALRRGLVRRRRTDVAGADAGALPLIAVMVRVFRG